jgi:hypothetical protein
MTGDCHECFADPTSGACSRCRFLLDTVQMVVRAAAADLSEHDKIIEVATQLSPSAMAWYEWRFGREPVPDIMARGRRPPTPPVGRWDPPPRAAPAPAPAPPPPAPTRIAAKVRPTGPSPALLRGVAQHDPAWSVLVTSVPEPRPRRVQRSVPWNGRVPRVPGADEQSLRRPRRLWPRV